MYTSILLNRCHPELLLWLTCGKHVQNLFPYELNYPCHGSSTCWVLALAPGRVVHHLDASSRPQLPG